MRRKVENLLSNARVVFLGSCGGFSNTQSALEKAESSSIIATKGEGAMAVNDPLLKMLNETMLDGNGIQWPAFWTKARSAIKDPRFEMYIAPHLNVAAQMIAAYRKML